MKSLLILVLFLSALSARATGWGDEPPSAAGKSVSPPPGTNTIYVWFLPSARNTFTPDKIKAVVSYGNDYLGRLGVKTRMIGLILDAGFSAAALGPRDAICVVGDKPQVLKMTKAAGVLAEGDAAYAEGEWQPDANNPETALRRDGQKKGWTFIGDEAVVKMAAMTKGKSNAAQFAALVAIHGVGHESGLNHLNDADNAAVPNFLDAGSLLTANIGGLSGLLMPKTYKTKTGYETYPTEITPHLTAIEDLFKAEEFAKRLSSANDEEPATRRKYQKYHEGKSNPWTQRAAWLRMLGDDASSPGPVCAEHPKACVR